MSKLDSILKYSFLALNAVAQVQKEIGASNGDSGVQQTKKQLAVAYVLAGAHAGETIPSITVKSIAGVVDLNASIAKALGLFGKTPEPVNVTIPAI